MCLLLLLNLPPNEPPWFPDLLRKLLIADLAAQLPGTPLDHTPPITDDEARKLLGRASVLSLSDDQSQRAIAYEIATRLIELFDNRIPGLISAADVILSRIGNFPGRKLLRQRYARGEGTTPEAPARLGLERIGRELENTVEIAGRVQPPLTDFQYEFLASLESATSVSVSAPTSAGKSFILGLDLIRRLRKVVPACVVYVVPTRALIREVTLTIRKHLREAGMEGVPVRSVPFPITQDKAPQGAVFILTQERLLSLLHSREGTQWITTLVVDEAQSIRDEARGVILQTAIEAVLIKHPQAEAHFASPLASNPEFLLDVVQRRDTGRHLVRTLSPVSQNLILVTPVRNKPGLVDCQLVGGTQPLELGRRSLSFKMNAGVYKSRALFAREVTKPDEITLLYANTPGDAEELAEALIEGQEAPGSPDPDIRELIEFVRSDLHPDYPLIRCLPHGVAYHYGFMPAIVRARVEDLCRDGKLKYVCCTSTLLQGVNLPARHIIIENPKRGSKNVMSRADFLNLAGRAGRLLQEFHGNVWCLRPATWEEKSYEGAPLTEIRSAMNEAMADGGTIVQKVLRNEVSGKELDYGEATLGKVYCDFVRGQRDLAESPWKTQANSATLAETASLVAALPVTLPNALLDANRAVRPDRLQKHHDYLAQLPSVLPLIPAIPRDKAGYARLEAIIKLLCESFAEDETKLYRRWNWLSVQWVYNQPLREIIKQDLASPVHPKGPQTATARIRALMEHIEVQLRFRLVKYFIAHTSILEHILRGRDDAATADALEPFHVYLECGASDRVALSLIALGLSRATALALRDKISFPEEASPESCLATLAALDLRSIQIPSLCLREVRDLFGRD
ncbi:MAG: DEAD/DEAH box helicase [Phycisphaeraceae bacterium]|nr:MAG: DEAD/DEAH box helicase [Phycisphaeraceae bacterium]